MFEFIKGIIEEQAKKLTLEIEDYDDFGGDQMYERYWIYSADYIKVHISAVDTGDSFYNEAYVEFCGKRFEAQFNSTQEENNFTEIPLEFKPIIDKIKLLHEIEIPMQ